jgi:hypothetical protein
LVGATGACSSTDKAREGDGAAATSAESTSRAKTSDPTQAKSSALRDRDPTGYLVCRKFGALYDDLANSRITSEELREELLKLYRRHARYAKTPEISEAVDEMLGAVTRADLDSFGSGGTALATACTDALPAEGDYGDVPSVADAPSTPATHPASVDVEEQEVFGVPCMASDLPPVHRARVVGVASDDRLNLRAGPGARHPAITSVPNGTDLLVLDGTEVTVDGGIWVQVEVPGPHDPDQAAPQAYGCAWVNARYLDRTAG